MNLTTVEALNTAIDMRERELREGFICQIIDKAMLLGIALDSCEFEVSLYLNWRNYVRQN